MEQEKYLNIMRLRVTGKKTCDYKLRPGVNIFKGSNSTGKTTLIWFFDFVFGSKSKPFIPIIEKNCEYVYVDMKISGNYYTIKRDIETKDTIYVYDGIYDSIDELEKQTPKKYGWIKSKEKENITTFFFENLGIQPGKVPISSSRVAKFSWRNLISLIYVPQNQWVGIQVKDRFQPLMKKSVFEIIFGIMDEIIKQKEEKIRDTQKEHENYKIQQKVIQEFLDKNERELGSDEHVKKLEKMINEYEEKKSELHRTLKYKTESNTLIEEKKETESLFLEKERTISLLKEKLDELEMLDSENKLNLEKNRFLLKAKKIFSELPVTKCPKCLNEVTRKNEDKCYVCGQNYRTEEEKDYAQNLFLLMDDQKELLQIIQNVKNDISVIDAEKKKVEINLSKLTSRIDEINKEIISPVMKEIEGINSKLNQLNKQLGEAEKIHSLIQQEKINANKVKRCSEEIAVLGKFLEELTDKRLSSSEVTPKFVELMSTILKDVLNISEKLDGLDNKYSPLFKGDTILNNLSSGDIEKSKRVRVILAYYTTILEYGLKYGSNHPKLLILDTPRQDELDMNIFSKIIDYWKGLSRYNKTYQIIITGSEFPQNCGCIIDEFHNPIESEDSSKPAKFSVM